MTETSPVAAVSLPPRGVELGTTEEMDWRAIPAARLAGRGAAHRRRRRQRPALGRRGGRRDPGAGARGSPARTTAIPHRRSSTTAGCAPATSPASRRNGYVQITDRSKDVIKSGGEWISSVELEGHLMAHPDVVEAAVIAVPDPRWDERPLACVVCKRQRVDRAHRAPRVPRRRTSPSGSSPSAGRSSTKCRRRASASSTRRCCAAQYADGELWSWRSSRSTSRSHPRPTMTTTARGLGVRAPRRRPVAARPRVRVRAARRHSHRARARGAPLVRRDASLSGIDRLGRRRAVVALWIASDTQPAVRRLRPQPLPLLAARRDGGRGVARVPRASRDRAARADRAAVGAAPGAVAAPPGTRGSSAYAEITRIAVRNGLGPSLGLGRKDDVEDAARRGRRSGGSGSRSRSAGACS